jgi:HEAT repeat protein
VRPLEELVRAARGGERAGGSDDADALRARREAVRDLGRLGDPRAAPVLVELLADATPVRLAARDALAQLGEPALPVLRAALAHLPGEIRRAAIQVVDEIGGPGALDLLTAALGDADASVRWVAADRLGARRAAIAFPSLIALLGDPHPAVRATAVSALAAIGRAGTLPAIASLLGDAAEIEPGFTVGDRAAIALARLGDASAADRVLATMRRRADASQAAECAAALAALGPAAVAGLAEILGDTSLLHAHAAAARALETIESPAARAALDRWRRR